MSTSYFQTVLNTTITSIYPYPPPIIVKHHCWYFDDADFFIMIRGIVYGLHRRLFERSTYFSKILNQNEPEHDIPRGVSCFLPIPFDSLSTSHFAKFLDHLYYPDYFIATEEDWKNIRQLSLDWEFPHIAGIALLRVLEMRQRQLPPVMRTLLNHNLVHTIWRGQARRNRLYEIQVEESDSENEEIHRR